MNEDLKLILGLLAVGVLPMFLMILHYLFIGY